jgi:bifunctional DNA-binding transcriptional regulator/antitoxin component of YhaV-PrlF toxin-antitoxin module
MKRTVKITSKRQVTFRKEVLDQLGVKPGDKITVEVVGPARMEIGPARAEGSLRAFIGCLKAAEAPKLSADEMKEIARDGWARIGCRSPRKPTF